MRKLRLLSGRRTEWLNQGNRPDYRFSLANERTFLASIRTSLALIAGAVGIDQFAIQLGGPLLRGILALALLTVAALLSGCAYRHWASTEQAMRHDADLPPPRFFIMMSVFISALVIVLMSRILWVSS